MAEGRRQPTADERSGEKAFCLTMLADSALVTLLVVSAIASGSLTMLGEATRGVLLMVIMYYNFWLLRAIHRDSLSMLQFGTGKIEQFAWVIVGSSLVIGALWVGQSVFSAVTVEQTPASPRGLAFAAIVNAINLVINLLGWVGLRNAAGRMSGVLGAELNARFSALIGSAILQVTLTAAAIAKDPALVLLFDAMGAAFVVAVMLKRGIEMVVSGLSCIFDQPATPTELSIVRRAVEGMLPPDVVSSFRTRRGGDRLFVEIIVDPSAVATLGQLEHMSSRLRNTIAGEGVAVDLCVVPVPSRS